MRRYLLQSETVSERDTLLPSLSQPDLSNAGLSRLPQLTGRKNAAVLNEIYGQQVYEIGSNISESCKGSDDGFGEPTAEPQTSSFSLPSATDSGPYPKSKECAENLEPRFLITSEKLDLAISKLRPSLIQTTRLEAHGPIFGINLGSLYQRDGVAVPRVVQYCMAVAEQAGRQIAQVYDLEADEDDINYLKDRFDNGGPVQVNAQAILDQRTVDPRKLNFSKGDHILVLEPKDTEWFLGRQQDESGLFPIAFVQFSAKDIADMIGACKAFFMDLPKPLIPSAQYISLNKAAGNRSSTPMLLLTLLTTPYRHRFSWGQPRGGEEHNPRASSSAF